MDFQYKLGAIPSPPDDRDYQFKDIIAAVGELPSKWVNPYLDELSEIALNQGDSGECVCCAAVHLRWLQEREQNGSAEMLSPSYLYGNHTDDDVPDYGCFPRCVCSQTVKYGTCDFDSFPEYFEDKRDAHKEYLKRKDELDPKAYPYRTSSYYSCGGNSSIDTIKRAIMLRGGVMVLYICDYNFMTGITKFITPCKTNNMKYGGHEVLLVGWDDDKNSFIMLNSWGKRYIHTSSYDRKPWCYISYNYPIQETHTFVDDIKKVQEEEKKMFADTTNHWAEESINKAAQKGIVSGFDDGLFHPDEGLTRAQLCVILDKLGMLE